MSVRIPPRTRFVAVARGLTGLLLTAGIATAIGACGSKAAAPGSANAAPAGNGGTGGGATGGGSPGAAIGVNGSTITIRQAPGKVTMTGDLDASWKGVPAIHIDPNDPGVSDRGATAQNPVFTDQVYMQYDSQNLYIVESRTQKGPFQANGGDGQYYLGDTFMMFFDTDKDATGNNYIDGDYAFFITPFDQSNPSPRAWDREGHSNGGVNEHAVTNDVKMGYKQTSTGYNFAMTLPWKEVEVTSTWKVQKGSSIGFGLGAASQAADGTWGQMQFNSKADDQSTWGQLVLG